jgi:hypothetical protein
VRAPGVRRAAYSEIRPPADAWTVPRLRGGASLTRALPTAAKDLAILGLGALAFWALQAWLIRRGVKQHRRAAVTLAPYRQ